MHGVLMGEPPSAPTTCTILWSTQSGRAKACARRTARLLRSRGVSIFGRPNETDPYGCAFDTFGSSNFLSFSATVADATDTSARLSHQRQLLVAFVSTTGDAEQCDTIRNTWLALLRKSLPSTTFSNLQFALFALGDRAYGPTAFCAAGRKLAARLVQLGARPYCVVGYGDDGTPNGGVFADLDEWLTSELLPTFVDIRRAHAADTSIFLPEPVYHVKAHICSTVEEAEDADHELQGEMYRQSYDDYFASQCPATAYRYDGKGIESDPQTPPNPPLLGRVTQNERITSDDWVQDTRHIAIRVEKVSGRTQSHISPSSLPYHAGDIATILPTNSTESVERFLKVLPKKIGSMADMHLQISALPGRPTPWPTHCTLRGLLTFCADINSLPEREDLRALAPYCNQLHPAGSDHRDKLISLSETKEAALYGDYILREKRSWIDVLFDFDSIRHEGASLSLEHLLMLLPPIMPRHFSIASSPSKYFLEKGTRAEEYFALELCVAVVKGISPRGRSYVGLCSGFLSQSQLSNSVRLWVRPGSFGRLPLTPTSIPTNVRYFEAPVMCIGAGTGVAPLRSIIMEREAIRLKIVERNNLSGVNEENDKSQISDNILVFGCRKRSSDFYYEEEWGALSARGRLRLLTAFSRDQYYKMYVQRVAQEADNGALIARHILERGGAVYIAGGARMAHCMKEEIVECLAKVLHGGEKDAKAVLRKLAKAGKFSIEAWN